MSMEIKIDFLEGTTKIFSMKNFIILKSICARGIRLVFNKATVTIFMNISFSYTVLRGTVV
jgi:hypothetical protein